MKILTTSSLINEENYKDSSKFAGGGPLQGLQTFTLLRRIQGHANKKKIVRSMKIRRIYDDTDSESYGNNESGQ